MAFLKQKYTYFPAYITLIVLIYIIIFVHLERLPLHVWDEAHRGVNAQEVLRNNEWVVITYNDQPDLYGTKPPMLVWLQAISMKILGYGELAVRLPSALAGLGICLVLFLTLWKYLKNRWIAIIAILVLLSSWGFVDRHGTRSGDTDVLLSFFSLLFLINYFRFLEFEKSRYAYYTLLFLALATLTKSVAVFMFFPGALIYTIVYKKRLSLFFKNKHFYFSLIFFLVIVFGYYLTREIKSSGYLKAVWENEFAGRYLEVNDSNRESFWFYFNGLINTRFILCPIILGLPVVLLAKEKRIRRLAGYSSILSFSFLLVISFSKTKLSWYDLPVYPFLSIIIAIIIYRITTFFLEIFPIKKLLRDILLYAVIVLIFYKPITYVVGYTFSPEYIPLDKEFYQLSTYLKEKIESGENFTSTYIVEAEKNELDSRFPYRLSHILFYTNILNRQGSDILFKCKEDVVVGDNVIVASKSYKKYLSENFKVEDIEKEGDIIFCKIIGSVP